MFFDTTIEKVKNLFLNFFVFFELLFWLVLLVLLGLQHVAKRLFKLSLRLIKWGHRNLVRLVALLIGAAGIYVAILGAKLNNKTFVEVFNESYANISTELISIALTVLVINELYSRLQRQTEEKELKAKLIRMLGSDEREVSIPALQELRAKGWGFTEYSYDGSRFRSRNISGNIR